MDTGSGLRMISVACLGIAALGLAAPASAAGDPAKGRIVFARCAVCHDVKPGVKKIGPSLAGLFGREAGSMPGFAYSAAMKASKIVWTPQSLDVYLVRPAKSVPGTKMIFMGLPNPADRANVIAYLEGATK